MENTSFIQHSRTLAWKCNWAILLAKIAVIHSTSLKASSLLFTTMGFMLLALPSAAVKPLPHIASSCCAFTGSQQLLTGHRQQQHFKFSKNFSFYRLSRNYPAMIFIMLLLVVQITLGYGHLKSVIYFCSIHVLIMLDTLQPILENGPPMVPLKDA